MGIADKLHQVSRYKLYAPHFFYTPILALICTAAGLRGKHTVFYVAALLASGFLSWGLIEYTVHRFVLHSKQSFWGARLPGNLTHLRHHARPQELDRLHVALRESIPVSLAYCLLAWLLLGSWQSMVWAYTGMMMGYFLYECLDLLAHHGAPRSRLLRYFCRYHLQHHYHDARARYGVTTPLFDYLFGTFHLEKKAPGRRKAEGARLDTPSQEVRVSCAS